ncbi:hypothetical protein [Variovorax sp. 160MFSha2.1]
MGLPELGCVRLPGLAALRGILWGPVSRI